MRRVSAVLDGSPAQRYRLKPGDIVLSINGEPVLDEIDYQALTATRLVRMLVGQEDGSRREIGIIKDSATPLGLQFDDSIIGNPKTCGNNCLFCFVEQMPKGMRQSLYVKDDDWRLSLLMGNYITLTNVGEREFSRIIKRKASPLYISVHATDPDLRTRILGNKHGSLLMERLYRLKEAGLSFHCQLVLCPGLNDGQVMLKSLRDLEELHPAALSVALVPVGLTRFREGLPPIRPYTREEAREIVDACTVFQAEAQVRINTRFAFPADEFLSLAEAPIPAAENYEAFAQIENGIGMLRQFEDELRQAHEADKARDERKIMRTILLPCGTALVPYLDIWIRKYCPSNVTALVMPIRNDFFGETVTVTGLICASDLIKQLSGKQADEILLAETMLNSDRELFLDDLTPGDVEKALGIPVRVFRNTGTDFYRAMAGTTNRTEIGD